MRFNFKTGIVFYASRKIEMAANSNDVVIHKVYSIKKWEE